MVRASNHNTEIFLIAVMNLSKITYTYTDQMTDAYSLYILYMLVDTVVA